MSPNDQSCRFKMNSRSKSCQREQNVNKCRITDGENKRHGRKQVSKASVNSDQTAWIEFLAAGLIYTYMSCLVILLLTCKYK